MQIYGRFPYNLQVGKHDEYTRDDNYGICRSSIETEGRRIVVIRSMNILPINNASGGQITSPLRHRQVARATIP
jgi:hypothetical protein